MCILHRNKLYLPNLITLTTITLSGDHCICIGQKKVVPCWSVSFCICFPVCWSTLLYHCFFIKVQHATWFLVCLLCTEYETYHMSSTWYSVCGGIWLIWHTPEWDSFSVGQCSRFAYPQLSRTKIIIEVFSLVKQMSLY